MIRPLFAIISFFSFFCFNSILSKAQDPIPWSLEKCISFALENNIQLKQQNLNTIYRKNLYSQSKLSYLPYLNAGADQGYSYGRSIDPYTNEFISTNVRSNNFYLSGGITLFNGFQIYNTMKENEYNFLSSLQDLEKVKNDISLNIAAAYLQIIFNEELVSIAENQLNITKQQLDRTSRLYEAGTLAKGNVLDIQAQAATEELQLINAKNQLESSYLTLKQILEFKSDSVFSIEHPQFPDPDEATLTMTIDEVFNKALALPQIKSAELLLKSYEKALSVARAGRYPRLSLSGAYYTGYSDARQNYDVGTSQQVQIGYVGSTNAPVYYDNPTLIARSYPFKNQLKDNASKMFSFRLSIPIFNGWQVQTNISNSKLNYLNTGYRLQLTKNNLYKDIQQAYTDALAALAKYKGSKKALESNEESFKYSEQKFNLGLVNSIDYNTAKNKLTKAKSDLLQSKYEFIFKRNILNFYAGKPINL